MDTYLEIVKELTEGGKLNKDDLEEIRALLAFLVWREKGKSEANPFVIMRGAWINYTAFLPFKNKCNKKTAS